MSTIQISLDVPTVDEALKMARAAVRAGVDWLEAGTPLVMGEGVHAVRALRKEFPSAPIVADIKCMDGGGIEAKMMFEAGANKVVVMGQAHDATIIEAVKMARHFNGQIMVDVMLCADKASRARRAQELGAEIVIVHTGYDERNMIRGLSPLNDLQRVLDAVTIPVQAVGGLSVDQAIDTLALGANIVVFGAPLVVGGRQLDDLDEFEMMLSDIVKRVKGTR